MEDRTFHQCGAIGREEGVVHWRVWAPRAERVELVLGTGKDRHLQRMRREERGYFSYAAANIAEGQRYAYCLDNGPERPDPASRWQPDGVHQPSAVLRPEYFQWSDHAWTGMPREDLVLYELHVGTFAPEGTFEAIIPRLPALRDLGITAIELMPVAQFPGTRNWGYDGVYPYAPQNSYGGPHGLQRLVDACHAQGLALFLDVVYNHFGPEGCYVQEFGWYFTDRYRTPWGRAVNYDDRGCDAVRAYVLENVRMWLEDYHMDGLRLDAVHAIFDLGPRHILGDIQDTADAISHRHNRQVHVVAESDLNDVRLLLPRQQGGYGLAAQWSDDFHHTVHAYLTGEQRGYYIDYGRAPDFPKLFEETFVLNGGHSMYRDRSHGAPVASLTGDHFVVCIQNHDQVGNRAVGERLGVLISPAAQRLAAGILLLAPYLPLLFMGEEYGEEHPFQFFCSFSEPDLVENVRIGRWQEFAAFHTNRAEVPDPQAESTLEASRLTWSWEQQPHKAGLRRLYHDLLQARRTWPAMRDFTHRAARLLPGTKPHALLELSRGVSSTKADTILQAYFNLTPGPQPLPYPAGMTVLWSSEAEQYDGSRRADWPLEPILLPYECVVFGPPTWQRYSLTR